MVSIGYMIYFYAVYFFILTCWQFASKIRLTRKEIPSESNILTLSTHFYAKLFRDGAESVQTWTSSIDIFTKKMIFVPVNKDLHWSMFVIVNAGLLRNLEASAESKAEMPFMFFLDSGRNKPYAHDMKELKTTLYEWLNYHASHCDADRFNNKTNPFRPSTLKICEIKCKYKRTNWHAHQEDSCLSVSFTYQTSRRVCN